MRSLTRAGGTPRLLMNAEYRYDVKGQPHTITLPLESLKLNAPGITDAVTTREHEREIPERLELSDGTTLDGRETIRMYYFEKLLERTPTGGGAVRQRQSGAVHRARLEVTTRDKTA
ncbi:MAG: hypothetical protein HC933_07070 [Pleurocapsa sp. SU_196_0]|nr:hypothetical protein [Pleurocapsa sp. SU_196_0]